eukprot:gene7082-5018_t
MSDEDEAPALPPEELERLAKKIAELPTLEKLLQEKNPNECSGEALQHAAAVVSEVLALQPATESDLTKALRQAQKKHKKVFQKSHLLAGYRHLQEQERQRHYGQVVDLEDVVRPPRPMPKIAPTAGCSELPRSAAVYNETLEAYLVSKAPRSQSGVLVVTVFTSAYPEGRKFSCEWNCYYCPNEPGQPRSYLLNEPGVRRANRMGFDPVRQFNERVSSLYAIGHPADKVELLVLGGTWESYPTTYREDFIRDLFYAANCFFDHPDGPQRDKLSLLEEQLLNETSKCKIIGVTLETRPDTINQEMLVELRRHGCTRVQLGVQHTDDGILMGVNRQATREDTVRAIKLLKDNCFKVDIHLMPDLPGATPSADRAMFDDVVTSPELQADQWKIYPCQTTPFTLIEEWYRQGKYKPYGLQPLIDVILYAKRKVPPWIRLNRVIRDIPIEYVLAGIEIANLRQLLAVKLRETGDRCRCIRCREVKGDKDVARRVSEAVLVERTYVASAGTEHFLSFESPEDECILGFLRLRVDMRDVETPFPELVGCALIRELHVYGNLVTTQGECRQSGKAQHSGIGTRLLERAEEIAKAKGYQWIAVISGIGVRGYYRRRGYQLCSAQRGGFLIKCLKDGAEGPDGTATAPLPHRTGCIFQPYQLNGDRKRQRQQSSGTEAEAPQPSLWGRLHGWLRSALSGVEDEQEAADLPAALIYLHCHPHTNKVKMTNEKNISLGTHCVHPLDPFLFLLVVVPTVSILPLFSLRPSSPSLVHFFRLDETRFERGSLLVEMRKCSAVFTELEQLLSYRVVLLDGGMGTMAQQLHLGEDDFRGREFARWDKALKGNNDFLNISQPDYIQHIHLQYALAGADILLTNTVCSQSLTQARYGADSEALIRRMNIAGAALCRQAADAAQQATGRRIYVGGSLGPTHTMVSCTPFAEQGSPHLTFDILVAAYLQQAAALLDGGVDLLVIETIVDPLNAKAALYAVRQLVEARGYTRVPVLISVTVTAEGKSITGQEMAAFFATVRHGDIFSIGINCSSGTSGLFPAMSQLAAAARLASRGPWLHCYPNAGLPSADGRYHETPEDTAAALRDMAAAGVVHMIGGCCGTTPAHIRAVADAVRHLPAPVPPAPPPRSKSTEHRVLLHTAASTVLVAGEASRYAVADCFSGTAAIRRAASATEAWDACVALAREAVRRGAAILVLDTDEVEPLVQEAAAAHEAAEAARCWAMSGLVSAIGRDPALCRCPLLLQSASVAVLVAGLKCSPGRSMIRIRTDAVSQPACAMGGPDLLTRSQLELLDLGRDYGASAVLPAPQRSEDLSRMFELLRTSRGLFLEDIIIDATAATSLAAFPPGAAVLLRDSQGTFFIWNRLIRLALPPTERETARWSLQDAMLARGEKNCYEQRAGMPHTANGEEPIHLRLTISAPIRYLPIVCTFFTLPFLVDISVFSYHFSTRFYNLSFFFYSRQPPPPLHNPPVDPPESPSFLFVQLLLNVRIHLEFVVSQYGAITHKNIYIYIIIAAKAHLKEPAYDRRTAEKTREERQELCASQYAALLRILLIHNSLTAETESEGSYRVECVRLYRIHLHRKFKFFPH